VAIEFSQQQEIRANGRVVLPVHVVLCSMMRGTVHAHRYTKHAAVQWSVELGP
jgi:hypothetical protein